MSLQRKTQIVIPQPITFEWDAGNQDKNWRKHGVTQLEIEEVFFDEHKKLFPPVSHPSGEMRQLLIGKTQLHRLLFVVFTVRRQCIRVISARDLNRKERSLYEEKN